MEWTQLWAGVTFAAQNGDAEGLLTAAAAGGLHLSDIVPRPGGFSARCAAWHYRKLAALARRRRVRLRIQKRQGLFFCIRPLLRRRGLWAGCLVFLPLLLWLQGFVWFVEPAGLTPRQQALAAVKKRDYDDSHRAAAPLKQAEDAVLLDTSELDFEQSLDAMKQIIAQKIGG